MESQTGTLKLNRNKNGIETAQSSFLIYYSHSSKRLRLGRMISRIAFKLKCVHVSKRPFVCAHLCVPVCVCAKPYVHVNILFILICFVLTFKMVSNVALADLKLRMNVEDKLDIPMLSFLPPKF